MAICEEHDVYVDQHTLKASCSLCGQGLPSSIVAQVDQILAGCEMGETRIVIFTEESS